MRNAVISKLTSSKFSLQTSKRCTQAEDGCFFVNLILFTCIYRCFLHLCCIHQQLHLVVPFRRTIYYFSKEYHVIIIRIIPEIIASEIRFESIRCLEPHHSWCIRLHIDSGIIVHLMLNSSPMELDSSCCVDAD